MKRAVRAAAFPLVLAVMLAAGSCAGRGGPRVERGEVEVQVANVGFDQDSGAHYVVLEEQAGKRSLPIQVGEDEARAILFELHGIKPERPLTYELLREVIEKTGNQVDRVVIAEVHDQVYYAKIVLDRGRYRIDSRPSDAIALAMGANAPIYVADKLFQTTSGPVARVPAASAMTISGLGLTVQQLTPELARYFSVDPASGVLIADLEPQAVREGLERGDILLEVASKPVRTPQQFGQAVAQLKKGSEVVLTVRRGTTVTSITLKPIVAPGNNP
jgi:uncharacterized protein